MTDYQNLQAELLEGKILRVALNRPSVMNALNVPMLKELLEVFSQQASQPTVRCVILTGNGRAFCSGQDLEERRAFAEGGEPPSLLNSLQQRYNPLIMLIRNLPKPVIASINGVAAGAGCAIALACDMRLASTESNLILSFVNVGLGLDSGASYTLPRLVGTARAFELAVLGERVSGTEAERLGLVNRAVPPDQLALETLTLAQRIAAGPSEAIGRIKNALAFSEHATLAESLEHEAVLQQEAAQGDEYPARLRSFFQRKTS